MRGASACCASPVLERSVAVAGDGPFHCPKSWDVAVVCCCRKGREVKL